MFLEPRWAACNTNGFATSAFDSLKEPTDCKKPNECYNKRHSQINISVRCPLEAAARKGHEDGHKTASEPHKAGLNASAAVAREQRYEEGCKHGLSDGTGEITKEAQSHLQKARDQGSRRRRSMF